MKRNLLWMLAAILICGTMFTSCKDNDDNPATDIITEDIDLKDPLTIEAVEDGEIDICLEAELPEPIYYSLNGGEKQIVVKMDEDDEDEDDEDESLRYTTLTLKAGDKVQLFSRNTTLNNDHENNNGFYIAFDTDCYVYGNVMSLISPDGNWKDNKEIKAPYALLGLFSYASIVNHPTRRIMLPATKLSKDCYSHMFAGTTITIAPELPATQLEESCYEFTFCWCEALTLVPELPATQLAKDCYCGMFASCSSLTKAPQLPATQLAEGCYQMMFKSCEKLTEAPELPATTMETSCYNRMFSESALTAAPVLPATTLAESCYESMFSYCEALTEAPALPVTQLAKRCYAYMFSHCKNLTGTIELPAEQLPERCYGAMFEKCSKLNSIKCMATTMTGEFALASWLEAAGTDESVSTRTLMHAPGTPWVNSDEYSRGLTDWFAPTGWTLVSL